MFEAILDFAASFFGLNQLGGLGGTTVFINASMQQHSGLLVRVMPFCSIEYGILSLCRWFLFM